MAADPESWEMEAEESGDRRPSELVLAVKLLAATTAFKVIEILLALFHLGLDWVQSNPSAWLELGGLAIWVLLIALLWMGNAFARTLLLVAMAWDIMSALSSASILYAAGASGLLGSMPWVNIAVELCAGCLLLQPDCLEWFRKRN